MSWLKRNAEPIEAVAASVTACVTLGALVAISIQLEANDLVSRQQSARESYRSHLALATANPEFAAPADTCALLQSDRAGAYESFVEHLFYSAEQMLAVEDGWQDTFQEKLGQHAAYLCMEDTARGDTPELIALLQTFRATACTAEITCQTEN